MPHIVDFDSEPSRQWGKAATFRIVGALRVGGVPAYDVALRAVIDDARQDGDPVAIERLAHLVTHLAFALAADLLVDDAVQDAHRGP